MTNEGSGRFFEFVIRHSSFKTRWKHEHAVAGPALRTPDAVEKPRSNGGSRALAGAGHRSEHGDFHACGLVRFRKVSRGESRSVGGALRHAISRGFPAR